MRLPRGKRRLLLLAGLMLLAWAARQLAAPAGDAGDTRATAIAEAFRERRSGVMVEASGKVERLLTDDREGSRHQRMIVRLAGSHTVLVSHNIDLAPRVPAAPGDRLDFRGQYEWNDRGGVVHWTHADPQGRRPGGWLRHGERTYR
jgi:hypothetical protein